MLHTGDLLLFQKVHSQCFRTGRLKFLHDTSVSYKPGTCLASKLVLMSHIKQRFKVRTEKFSADECENSLLGSDPKHRSKSRKN